MTSKGTMNTTLTNETSPPVVNREYALHIDDRSRLMLVVLGISVVIMGVLGNSFILLCVLIFRRLHVAHYLFVCSLVAADLILSSYIVLLFVVHLALKNDWMTTGLSCKLSGIFFIAAGWSVVLSLFLLTLNRYLYLCKKTWFDFLFSKEICIILTLSIWVGGLVGTLPFLLDHKAGFDLDPVIHICMYRRKESYYISAIGFIVLIIICGLIFCLVYEIYRTARILELRNEAAMSLRDLDSKEGEGDSDFRLQPSYKRKGASSVPLGPTISKRELRFAWGLAFIGLCRLLFSLPFIIVSLADRTSEGPPAAHQVAFFLMILSSCVNWGILLVFDVALHRSLKKALCGQGKHGENENRYKKDLSADTSSGTRWPKIKRDGGLSRDTSQRSSGYEVEEESKEARSTGRQSPIRRLQSCWYDDEPSVAGSETEEEQRKRLERNDWKRRAFWNIKRPEPHQPQEVVAEEHEDQYVSRSFISRQVSLWLSGDDYQAAIMQPDAEHEDGTRPKQKSSRKSSPVRFQKHPADAPRSSSSLSSNDEGDLQARFKNTTQQRSKMPDMVVQIEKNGQKVRLQDMVEVWLDTLRRSQGGSSLQERDAEVQRQKEQQNDRHDNVIRAVRRKMSGISYSSETGSSSVVSRKEVVRTHWKNLAHDAARTKKNEEPSDIYNRSPGTQKRAYSLLCVDGCIQ